MRDGSDKMNETKTETGAGAGTSRTGKRQSVHEFFLRAAAFLYVPKCIGCGEVLRQRDARICPVCRAAYDTLCRQKCPFCGEEARECCCVSPLLREAGVSAAYRTCSYRGEGKRVITSILFRLKNRHSEDATEFLARMLAARIRDELPEGASYRICCVPRSPASVREIGYDHAAELGKVLSRLTGIPTENAIARRGDAKRQKELSAEARRLNAHDTLFLAPGVDPAGKRYLILDDVITTGHTLARCAVLLRSAGASDVRVLTVASAE